MSRKLILLVGAVLGIVAALLVPASPAWAAPPSNDSFAGARVISGDLPLAVTGRTTEATEEPGEPDHAGNSGGRSVWYSWTPTASGPVVIDTCESAFAADTLLAVYTGPSLVELAEVASNDDGCPHTLSTFSRVRLDVIAGTEYRIVVDGYDAEASAGFTLALGDGTPPPNDHRADATPLDGPLPLVVGGTSANATREVDEPAHGGAGQASVWYSWTATTDGPIEVDVCDASFDTLLGVYTEAPSGELEVVARNDDGCGSGRSATSFVAVGGTTYLVAVDGWVGGRGAAEGPFTLRLDHATGPANDDVAGATELGGSLPIAVSGSNVAATTEPEEPVHGGVPGGRSVWFAWTPEASGAVLIDTCGTFDLDTVLAVYTGTAAGDLVPVVADDDACAPRASRVPLDAEAGTRYLIAVDGFGGGQGGFTLAIHDADSRPANDDFADAVVLDGPLPLVAVGTTDGATAEPTEPEHGWIDQGYGTVWYRWTSEVSGPVTVDTCDGETYAWHQLAVHTGDSLSSLTLVEADDGECATGYSRLTLDAVAGTTYHIALMPGQGGGTSQFELRIRLGAPANDNLASAQDLDGPLPLAVDGTTVDATRELREPDDLGIVSTGGRPTIWYEWVADRSALVSVETCGSPTTSETAVDVHTGPGYDELAAVASSNGGCGRHSRLTFAASAGTRYLVRVLGGELSEGFGEGPIRLTLDLAPPAPTNDDLTGAEVLPSRLPVAVLASNVDAGAEPGEPAHGHLPASASLWWSWTAPRSGDVLLSTCGSATDTFVAVYSGSTLATLLPVASDDDGCLPQSLVRLAATAGTTYRIAVDSPGGDRGGVRLALRWEQEPANDDFAAARVLRPGLPLHAQGTTADAWIEPGELPEPSPGGAGQSVWYSWTPTSSGEVVVETCGSPTATFPSVWIGSELAALRHVDAPVVDCGDDGSLRFAAVAGTRYSIAVDTGTGYERSWDQGGRFGLTIRRPAAPANDEFAAATNLVGRRLPIRMDGTTVDATGPVWYRWTATTATPVVIDACGGAAVAAVAVSTGAAEPELVPVEDDGADPNERSTCSPRFTPVPGTTYTIAVGGAGSDHGRFELAIRRHGPPGNDDLAAAAVLRPSLPAVAHVDLTDAGVEAGEAVALPASYPQATAWWTWTPTRSGPVVVDTCGSAGRTEVAVYTGRAGVPLDALDLVGWDESTCATGGRLDLDAVAGTTYRIVVISNLAGVGAGAGAELRVRRADPPANDDVGDARVLRHLGAIDGSTLDATGEPGEPNHAGTGVGSSVWHRWTAPRSERIAVDTCGSGFPAAVAVYTGSPNALRHVASDDGGGVCGTGSMVVFETVAGTSYLIAVDGARSFAPGAGHEGDYVLRLSR